MLKPRQRFDTRTRTWALATVLIFVAVFVAWSQAASKDVTTARVSTTEQASGKQKGVWMLAYFRQRYDARVEIDTEGKTRTVPLPNPMKEEKLHLAISSDGRHWTPLNDNRPVWNQRLRDPFVGRGPDGRWRLLATGAAPGPRPGRRAGPVCLAATSRDLVTWEDARSLALMRGVVDETGRPARNIWAPEWFLDVSAGDFVVIWSSSFEDAGWKKSQLWFARTRDWKTFTQAKVLFAPDYSVIDGTLLEHNGTFYLFHKEEEFGAKTGERRAIRLAISKHLEGPYTVQEGPLNHGQIAPVITEGPCVMPDPIRSGWLLLYDFCMSDGYGISSSPDLREWTIEKGVSFPPEARHASTAWLSEPEAAALRTAFPGR